MKILNDALARFQFWLAKKSLKEGKDFKIEIDSLGLLVSILRGKFKGVQFRYANMIVLEDDGGGILDFATVIVYNPLNADVSVDKFRSQCNDILRIILSDSLLEKSELKVTDENRNVDTVELDQEREFHEEKSPLLEKRVSERKPRKKTVRTDSAVHPEIQQSSKPKRTRTRTTGKN